LFRISVFTDYSEFEETGAVKGLVRKRMVDITLSPHHLKVLSSIIKDQIERYEKNFGEISLKEPPKGVETSAAYIR
jgi:hypothetical protein